MSNEYDENDGADETETQFTDPDHDCAKSRCGAVCTAGQW